MQIRACASVLHTQTLLDIYVGLMWSGQTASVCVCLSCRRDGKSLEKFLEDYFAGKLKRHVKSEAVPASNSGPVKVCHKL